MDATFPEGPLKGNAMMMTTSDGDGKNRTLMFALVSSETGRNWEWFIRMAKKYFPNLRLLLTDRQNGPQSERVKHFLRKARIIMRPCAFHICKINLDNAIRRDKGLTCSGLERQLLWTIVKTTDPVEYGRLKAELSGRNEKLYEWIKPKLELIATVQYNVQKVSILGVQLDEYN